MNLILRNMAPLCLWVFLFLSKELIFIYKVEIIRNKTIVFEDFIDNLCKTSTYPS